MPNDTTPDLLHAMLETLNRIEDHMAALRNIFVPANDPRRQPPWPGPTPTPAPTPRPPAPQPPTPSTPPPSGSQAMKIGGTNNYALGGEGTILVFPLPKNWPDGAAVDVAGVQFASVPGHNFGVEQYEVAFSPIPGDFDYYKSEPALVKMYGQTFHPAGDIGGADIQLAWGKIGSISTCQIDDRQWYMNWRVLNCPPGATCGQTFYVPRG